MVPHIRLLHIIPIVDIAAFTLLFQHRKPGPALLQVRMCLRAQYQETPETKVHGRMKKPKS